MQSLYLSQSSKDTLSIDLGRLISYRRVGIHSRNGRGPKDQEQKKCLGGFHMLCGEPRFLSAEGERKWGGKRRETLLGFIINVALLE